MNIYLQCILPFERVAVMGLDNVCVLFSEVTGFFLFVFSATMATAPYNYSYIFKYIIIGKFLKRVCLSSKES